MKRLYGACERAREFLKGLREASETAIRALREFYISKGFVFRVKRVFSG